MVMLSRLLLIAGLTLLAVSNGQPTVPAGSPAVSAVFPLPPEPEGEETRLTVCTTWRSPAEVGEFYRRSLEAQGWVLEQEPVEVLPAGRWRMVATRPGWVLIAKWWYEGDLCLGLEVLDENLDRG